jgi:hypothetical protein
MQCVNEHAINNRSHQPLKVTFQIPPRNLVVNVKIKTAIISLYYFSSRPNKFAKISLQMQMVTIILPINYVDLPLNAPVNHQET